MKSWLRRLLIILTIGGSFTGFVLTLQPLFSSGEAKLLVQVLYGCFVALYAYGIFAGIRFSENEDNRINMIVFYWFQVPWISSPIFGYHFTSGLNLYGLIIGNDVNLTYGLGSNWTCNIFQPLPWGIGVNIFALVMLRFLMKKKAPDQPIETAPESITLPVDNAEGDEWKNRSGVNS